MNHHAAARPLEIALANEAPFELAGTHVRPAALELEWNGQVVSLEPRVMKVLVALKRADGQPVSRDELIDLCWGGRVVTEGALNRCVAQLRKALSDNANIRIETIPTVGYRLVARADEAAVIALPAQLNGAGIHVSHSTMPPADSVAANGHAHPRRAVPAAVAAGVLIAGALAAWLATTTSPVNWRAAAYRPLTSSWEEETFPALSPDGEQIVYASRPNSYSARDLYLRNVDQGTPVRITSHSEDDYGAAWSPAGDRIAFVRSTDDGPCSLVVVPVPLGPERVVARCEVATQTRPSWLDSRTLVIADHARAGEVSRIRAIDVETGVARDLTSPASATLGDSEPQVSPDGRYIVFRRTMTIGADGLYMLDVESGREQALTNDGYKALGYVWSADSRHVFFSSNRAGDFGLWTVDRLAHGPVRPVSPGLGTVSFVRMSADRNNRLAVEAVRGRTNIAKLTGSRETQPVTNSAGSDFDPAGAADGAVTYISNQNGAYEVWVTEPNGQSVRLTSIVGGYVTRPAWAPGGRSIAFVAVRARNAELYTVARDGSQLRQLTNDSIHKKDATYSAAGDRLFYVERRAGQWRLMQVLLGETASQPRAVPGGAGWNSVNAGPDGLLFGRREGENTIRALDTDGAAASGLRMSDGGSYLTDESPRITDLDVWTVGARGIYVRRGRQVHRPSSIWFYPWNEPGRKLAYTPLATGGIGLDANDNVLFSQTLDYQVDVGLMELEQGS